MKRVKRSNVFASHALMLHLQSKPVSDPLSTAPQTVTVSLINMNMNKYLTDVSNCQNFPFVVQLSIQEKIKIFLHVCLCVLIFAFT